MTDRIVGLVLAGGLATRMGGGDKGRLALTDGHSLLDEALARLRPQIDQIVLNANGDPARFADLGLPVVADALDGYLGPLAGVLAGLDWAAENGATHVASVAADTPFFPRDLVSRLGASGGAQGLAIAASADEGGKVWRQPTFGLWPVALRDDLRRALRDEAIRKIVIWTDRHNAGMAQFDPTEGVDPFFNVNTPDDLDRAQQIYTGLNA